MYREKKIIADTVSEMSPQKLFKQVNNGVISLKCGKKLLTCISILSKIFFKNEGKIPVLNRKIGRIHYQQPFTRRNANTASSGRRKIR